MLVELNEAAYRTYINLGKLLNSAISRIFWEHVNPESRLEVKYGFAGFPLSTTSAAVNAPLGILYLGSINEY